MAGHCGSAQTDPLPALQGGRHADSPRLFARLRRDQPSAKDRAGPVAQFQKGKAPLFLISLKAGGTGLNLTAADTVIHYDPWWNPAVEDQAINRAHRIGQKNPVIVTRFDPIRS